MAGGGGISSSPGKSYDGNFTSKVFFACAVAASGGLIFGYDLGISGGITSMDPFLKKFFPNVYRKEISAQPSDDQNSFLITRAFGRKKTMMLGGLLFTIGAIDNGFAVNLLMLIIGRVLLGLGIGFANQIDPFNYRGALNIMFQLSITIGILVANLLNYFTAKIQGGWGWRISLGGAVVPGFIFSFGCLSLSDSPNSLHERNKLEEAKDLLRKIRGIENVDEEFKDLAKASEAAMLVQSPWRDIISTKYRPQLTFAILIPLFQQLTCINVFVFYAPVLFKSMGFGDNASLMSALITSIVNFCSTLVSIATVDKYGRRTLFLSGGLQILACDDYFNCFQVRYKWESGSASALVLCYRRGSNVYLHSRFAYSWGPLGWLVPSEIFPLEIRPAAQSITKTINMIFTFAIPQVFTAMLCYLKFGIFIFFACFVVGMRTFIYKLLPETKGVPIEEMTIVWKNHPYWATAKQMGLRSGKVKQRSNEADGQISEAMNLKKGICEIDESTKEGLRSNNFGVVLVPNEIFPLEICPAAQSITGAVNMIVTFAIAQVFTAMLCNLKFGLFIFFTCCVVGMSTFIYKLLTETKGVPIEEMTIVWKNHPYWRML
ncbi:Sugar transport protein 1 [Hibiscus syriacus]|uniref:Sugar transport protein 1 n=1 Tax=Hibiscus syriacus TaxID=106335 RepID=A0A6A2Y2C7_HIBSY|nr:Sugar transport protein 1 [Hibiscus syriacus]